MINERQADQCASEHSADVIDNASRAESIATACALAATQARAQPERIQNEDGSQTTQGLGRNGVWAVPDCVVCDEEIPVERLRLGRVRCFVCQSLREKKQKGY